MKDEPYFLPKSQVAYVRARCCEELNRHKAATLFFGMAWRFDKQNIYCLSIYLHALRCEKQFDKAWTTVASVLSEVSHPQTYIDAMAVRFFQASNASITQKRNEFFRDQVRLFELFWSLYQNSSIVIRNTIAENYLANAFIATSEAYEKLEDHVKQLATIDKWVATQPNSIEARIIRGVLTYPDGESISDFRHAINLGTQEVRPYFFLAHHLLEMHEFFECDKLCSRAVKLTSHSKVLAVLLEAQAISRAHLSNHNVSDIRQKFQEAIRLDPNNSRLRKNARKFDADVDDASAKRKKAKSLENIHIEESDGWREMKTFRREVVKWSPSDTANELICI